MNSANKRTKTFMHAHTDMHTHAHAYTRRDVIAKFSGANERRGQARVIDVFRMPHSCLSVPATAFRVEPNSAFVFSEESQPKLTETLASACIRHLVIPTHCSCFSRHHVGEPVHRLLARVLLRKSGCGQPLDVHRVPFEPLAADSGGLVAVGLHSLQR